MKNKKKILIISIIVIAVISCILIFINKDKGYTVEITLVDGKNNPSRKLVVKKNNKEIKDALEIKTEKGIVIDKKYPWTINWTSVKKLDDYIIVVLKNKKEVKAKIINKGE